jgi:hypothetical protein
MLIALWFKREELAMIVRWIMVLGCVFAFTLAAPAGFDAAAAKKKNVACAATAMDGKKVKW